MGKSFKQNGIKPWSYTKKVCEQESQRPVRFMHSVLAYFSLFLAKWRLRMVCKPYMWHVHWDIFLFHGELEFTHSAVWFLIGQYHSLKTFKSVTRWIGSSHICGSGPMGCSVLPGVRVLVKASPPPPLQHLRYSIFSQKNLISAWRQIR